MKKAVMSAVCCIFVLQAFAINLSSLPFTSDFSEEQVQAVSDKIENALNAAQIKEDWRKSIVFIDVEISQHEVIYEGGGPRQIVDGKPAIMVYTTIHKHTCLGAITQPGVITTAEGCFFTKMERPDHYMNMPATLTVISEDSAFPKNEPVLVTKAAAVFKSHDGAVIMEKDITALINPMSEPEKMTDLLSWQAQTPLPAFAIPNKPQSWVNAFFVIAGKGTKYGMTQIMPGKKSGSYMQINDRSQRTAGDLVISSDGKYLLGINIRGRGTPPADFGITGIARPKIKEITSESIKSIKVFPQI